MISGSLGTLFLNPSLVRNLCTAGIRQKDKHDHSDRKVNLIAIFEMFLVGMVVSVWLPLPRIATDPLPMLPKCGACILPLSYNCLGDPISTRLKEKGGLVLTHELHP